MYKQNIEAAGVINPCTLLVILFYIINMHGLTRIGPTQSLLGYTDIVNLSSTLSSTEVYLINMAMNAFKRNHRCILQLDVFVMCKRWILMAK